MFARINDALNDVFLGGRFESRPLYLVLDNQGRQQAADSLGIEQDDVEEFCCKHVGAILTSAGDPYADAQVLLWRWVLEGSKGSPPFTALLFALSHAAEEMVTSGGFSAGNYYDRLSGLVNVSTGRLSQHGKSTEQFWKAFNGWLAANDFLYGRPTARPINTNKYVGVAMSQAIVREVDRQRFHSMYEKYGFTDTDSITESEIQQYLSSWIRSSKPTSQLKDAWTKTELRPRICEAALAELSEWQKGDGTTLAAADQGGVAQLTLALDFRHEILGRSVAIHIGRDKAIEPAEFSTENGLRLVLSNSTFGGFATLEPRSQLDFGSTLLNGIELSRGDKIDYRWKGRAAIPFSRSDQGYWTEVSRVSLGVDHLVLVRADKRVRDAIEIALGEVATPGYSLATPNSLPGLPAGWVLYEKVKVTRALDELRGFESILSPVGDMTGLQFQGGVKLGRGIWHLWKPPIARLDGIESNVTIKAWEGTASEGDSLCEASSDGSAVSLDLADCIPSSGYIFIEAGVGGRPVASASALFRSANRARPLDRQERGTVCYIGIVATAGVSESRTTSVRGLELDEAQLDSPNQDILERFQTLDSKGTRPANDPPKRTFDTAKSGNLNASLEVSELIKLPCAVRGFHVLRYDAVLPGTPRYAPINVECKDCDIAYLHRRKPSGPQGASRVKGRGSVPLSPVRKGNIEPSLELDLWLDGACFLGAGSAAVFETFAASSQVDTWRAGPALRDLGWLGHLDLVTGSTHRIKSWSVAPPVLSFIGEGEAVLAGFRSRQFFEALASAVSDSGGQLVTESKKNHPEIVKVRGLDAAQAATVLGDVCDPHGRSVRVVEAAARSISKFTTDHGAFEDMFKPATLGWEDDLQKYDVAQNCWRNVERPSSAGAFRVAGAGTSYVFRSKSGKSFSGPHEAVKLAAAREDGLSLHAYLEEERVFVSRLGCEPLGLLGRALVACSGELPEVIDGTSRFKNVPPDVAASVLAKMYLGEIPK